MTEERGTERTSVKTYVPKYQKEIWAKHADTLDMSQSEFVRSMVQAGRKKFEFQPSQDQSSSSHPKGNSMEERVLRVLDSSGTLSWNELLNEISDDFEEQLEKALAKLQEQNEIRYNGRRDGYTLVNDGQ